MGKLQKPALAIAAVLILGFVCVKVKSELNAAFREEAAQRAKERWPPPESMLTEMRSWPPGRVCTCGFVRDSTRPQGDVTLGVIWVSEKDRMPKRKESFNEAVCWWSVENTQPVVEKWQRVCVTGNYTAPTIQECRVVASCQ